MNCKGKDATKVKRYGTKMARKMAFSRFVTKLRKSEENGKEGCQCCNQQFLSMRDLHRHVGGFHDTEITDLTAQILEESLMHDAQKQNGTKNTEAVDDALPVEFCDNDVFPWLPQKIEESENASKGKVVLYYCYRDISNTAHVKKWQETLCKRLHLHGKIRVAKEGLNATASGTEEAIDAYVKSVRAHPLFCHLEAEDFKYSDSEPDVFHDGLKVGVYEEACPMGVPPEKVSHKNTGTHLTPEEFHTAMEKYLNDPDLQKEAVVIDCRNFYESKIGKFKGALAPDIRKFSYWPEYVDKNKEMLENKKIYMYCTGGIRCERGSAYIKEKGITNEVFQLKGGIHKYMEKYPDGYFRGKLFVFDDRYTIQSNDEVISSCVYCSRSWDGYSKCSSGHCHQLVLSCDQCRAAGLTACCRKCATTAQRQRREEEVEGGRVREECDCTAKRPRVSIDVPPSATAPSCTVGGAEVGEGGKQ